MYYRIIDRMEADLLQKKFSGEPYADLMSLIHDRIQTLDDNYGVERNLTGYGGNILFFPDSTDYGRAFPLIANQYGLDSALSEYSDVIATWSHVKWHEELFLLGSDFALVLVYPTERK